MFSRVTLAIMGALLPFSLALAQPAPPAPASSPAADIAVIRQHVHKDYAGKTLRENLGLRRPAAGAWKNPPQAAAA